MKKWDHQLTPRDILIREFSPRRDAAWLHALWHNALDRRWALSREAILAILANHRLLVAETEGRRSGFCAVDLSHRAALTVLLVEPFEQRRGIGTAMLMHAENTLISFGARQLTLGAAEGDYFWPGLPVEQSNALPFFEHHGFVRNTQDEPCEDLIQRLDTFRTPAMVTDRLASTNAFIQVADRTRRDEINSFERRHFPAWAPHFESEMQQQNYADILVAVAPDRTILGTILLKAETAIPWSALVGQGVGALNTLGVDPRHQGQGIGLALTAAAMLQLQQRGCSHCFVQWTGLAAWYAKLGTEPWAEYLMAYKPLSV